jgi:hypothetical protein
MHLWFDAFVFVLYRARETMKEQRLSGVKHALGGNSLCGNS